MRRKPDVVKSQRIVPVLTALLQPTRRKDPAEQAQFGPWAKTVGRSAEKFSILVVHCEFLFDSS
jgi:hypothetical protein